MKLKKYYEPIDKDDLNIYDNTNRLIISFVSHEDPINLFHNIINHHKIQNIKNI